MAFRVGQKVVCVIDSVYTVNDRGLPGFVKGQVFTVAQIKEVQPYGVFLGFHERDKHNLGHIDGFRPLVSKSTDTGFSILEDIRKRESVPADERVRAVQSAGQSGERS